VYSLEFLGNISEYWFHDYWRVLVIELSDRLIISVDVYRDTWLWNTDSIECIDDKNYCILYYKVSKDELNKVFGELSKYFIDAEIVGIKAKDRFETVNVRYKVSGDKKLTYNDISELFYKSWILIGCVFRDVEDIECKD